VSKIKFSVAGFGTVPASHLWLRDDIV
jgi:hypothetical protein